MSVDGIFLLSSNENYEAWLSNMGMPEEVATRMAQAKPTIELKKSEDTIEVVTKAGDKSFSNTVNLGKDSQVVFGAAKYTINLELDGKTAKGTCKLGDKTSKIVLAFSDEGVEQTLKIGGVTCKRVYKRQ